MAHNFSRILVTGGAGFIGSHIIDRLLCDGFEVIVIDNLYTGKLENIDHHRGNEDLHFIKGDIRDFDLMRDVLKDVDAVFHEAALVSVDSSVKNPLLANEINVVGTLSLLKACLDSGVKRFVYASSTAVYGDCKTLPVHENLVPRPISPYGASKLAAESYVEVFHDVYGLETVCLRYFNVYGPRQAYGPYSGVITIFVHRLKKGQPPIIYGDGEQTRDFTYVQDVVEANMLALSRRSAVGEILNIGTGVPTKMNRLAKVLIQVMDKTNLKPIYAKPRLGDIKHSYADISKARGILKYDPKFFLDEGLTKLVCAREKREGHK